MIERLTNWLKKSFGQEDNPPPPNFRHTPSSAARPKAATKKESTTESVELDTTLSGKIADAGPGKNVLIRNKYLREDTGTHETLKILDDSLVDSGEESGIDPYNTGGFDRSKNWNNRFRK